jgi:signal transduction histidine kinase
MKSLTFRLTLWYALVVTLTVGGVLFAGRFYLEDHLIAGIDLLNEVEFEEIRARLDDSDAAGPELVDAIKEHAELDAALYFFQIGGEGGEPLWKSSNLGPEVLPQAVHGHAHVTVFDDELGLIRSSEFGYAGLDIHIVSSLSNAEVLFRGYQTASFTVTVGVFLLSLGFGYFLSRLAMRPIAGIQMTARQITASNFDARIPVPNTNDEVSEMAVFLNEMLDRLEASYQQVKRFTAEASHEFRTPLSIIRLQAERLMERPDLSEEDRDSALAEQMEGVGRLNKVMDDLLLLAKSDAGVMPLDLHRVHLANYLEDFRCDCELLAEDRGVRFELEVCDVAEWVLDPVWMRNVLLNLFTNALNVSRAGQCVRLEVDVHDGCLFWGMKDEGAGLPEDQLERMFDRFERLDQPSGNSSGNGLGLAICRSIVERHGGRIFASNRSDYSGLCVEVVLKALSPSAPIQ